MTTLLRAPAVGAPAPNYLGLLAAVCYRQARRVVAGWVVALVAITALSMVDRGRFRSNLGGGHPESQQAQDLLKRRFPVQAGDPATIVFHTTGPLNAPTARAEISTTLD